MRKSSLQAGPVRAGCFLLKSCVIACSPVSCFNRLPYFVLALFFVHVPNGP